MRFACHNALARRWTEQKIRPWQQLYLFKLLSACCYHIEDYIRDIYDMKRAVCGVGRALKTHQCAHFFTRDVWRTRPKCGTAHDGSLPHLLPSRSRVQICCSQGTHTTRLTRWKRSSLGCPFDMWKQCGATPPAPPQPPARPSPPPVIAVERSRFGCPGSYFLCSDNPRQPQPFCDADKDCYGDTWCCGPSCGGNEACLAGHDCCVAPALTGECPGRYHLCGANARQLNAFCDADADCYGDDWCGGSSGCPQGTGCCVVVLQSPPSPHPPTVLWPPP